MREHKLLPATFNDRIHAFSVDYGLVALLMLISIFLQIHPVYGPYIKMAITLVAWYLVIIGPNFITPGSSLGKKNSDIIVMTEDYKEVTVKTMQLRATFILFATLLSAGLYIFISFVLLEKRMDKRAIHDVIFKTRVVRKTPFVGKSE